MRAFLQGVAAVAFVALIVSGCGEDAPDAASSTEGEDTAAEMAEQVAEAFVPAADQFGVEQFKVVYALEGQETGTRTMWVEDYGARVGMEDSLTLYSERQHKLYYWDGDQSHLLDRPDGEVYSTGLRVKASEPTAFATTPASSLETVGYERLGEKTLVGHTCEHWQNTQLNYEGCRWNNIELEFLNGAGTDRILQQSVATEFVEGEGIPDRIRALAE
ncbi:MAG: hypothetical protein HKN04_04225 [Rhodothermaceae bacterium]|nr:hypothetical protein [Rhodothermaceae bacterium]